MVHTIIPQMFVDFDHCALKNKSLLEDLLDVMVPTRYQNPQHFLVLRHPRSEKLTQNTDKHACTKQKEASDDVPAKSKDRVVTENGFTVKMNLGDFTPEEITVKLVQDNVLSIEAKHEEQDGEHGYVFRRVLKKFTVPEGFDLNKLASKLTTDGTLAITAPKIAQEEKTDDEERNIPISRSE